MYMNNIITLCILVAEIYLGMRLKNLAIILYTLRAKNISNYLQCTYRFMESGGPSLLSLWRYLSVLSVVHEETICRKLKPKMSKNRASEKHV